MPLPIAEIGAEVAGISARLAEEGTPNLRGDAVTASFLAGAGVRAAAALVEIIVSAGGADDRLSRAGELLAVTASRRRSSKAQGCGVGG